MSLWSSKKAPSDCEAQCPDCGAILSRLADMNRHRKTKHPDGTETKFSCTWSGCWFESTQKSNLKSHIDARHSGGPKYPCPECPRRFSDAAARIRHRKKLHGYVPYHTQEYIARQARNRKERMVQAAGKAVSNQSHHQQVLPNASPNALSSAPPSAPKLTEVAYHDDSWKMSVDPTHFYPPQPLPSQGVTLPLPFEMWPGIDTPNSLQEFPSPAQLPPLYPPQLLPSQDVPLSLPFEMWPGIDPPNSIQEFPLAAQSSSLYPPQPPPSQGVPPSSPFETWPGCVTPNSIQNLPSPAQSQSPPSLTPSDFSIDYYSGLHGPQLYTMQSQEQQFGGNYGMPPYNGDGQWNWQLQ